eukprot:11312035-Heterocapsa_arctica.AAC.1
MEGKCFRQDPRRAPGDLEGHGSLGVGKNFVFIFVAAPIKDPEVPIEGWLQIGLFLGHMRASSSARTRSVRRATSRAMASSALARSSSSTLRRPRSWIRRCARRS